MTADTEPKGDGLIFESVAVEELAVAKETDASVWAAAFVRSAARTPEMPTDYETMLSWFAVAIMAGYRRAKVEADHAR